MKWRRAIGWLPVGLGALAFSSCAPSGFQDEKLIQSVRILASSTDPPYAAPGSTVNVHVLAYDGRPTKAEPMTVYWLPFVCENPRDDAYYACFQQIARAGGLGGAADAGRDAEPGASDGEAGGDADAGSEAGTGAPVGEGGAADAGSEGGAGAPGGDSGLPLATISSFQFVMPSDVITTHVTPAGATTPYGLTILFNMACAGHLEPVPLDPGNVQSPPIGCFDAQHNRLGPNDYVLGFTRVYAYDQLKNTNPVIESIDVDGRTISINPDGTWPALSEAPCAGSCPRIHIGPVVPASSQEPNPAQRDVNGNMVKEEIWAAFYSTVGSWNDGVRLLYDASKGSVGGPNETDNQFQRPTVPGDGFIWIVVHDNRGGATWATIPVHVM